MPARPLPPTRFKIDNQAPGVGLGRDGKATQGYTVSFTTAKGNKGSVFIPQADYTLERAQELVSGHAAELDAVSDLTGG